MTSDYNFKSIAPQLTQLNGFVTQLHVADFNAVSTIDLINPSPITITDRSTIEEMFQLLRSNKQTISYLPVLNQDGQLTGAVNFNTLIKGEL